MTTANTAEYHTLLDWNLMKNAGGKELPVAKLMYQNNQFNKILPYREANDGVGHKIGIQTSLPTATLSTYGQPVKASHGTMAVITETPAFAVSPWKALYDLCRLEGAGVELMKQAEDHAEALAQTVESYVIYGNHDLDLLQPNGFMVRRNSLSGEIGKFTVDGGGGADSGKSLESIILLGIGPGAIYGIFPAGSATAGIESLDYGLQPEYSADGEVPMFKGRFAQYFGMAEDDHRYSVRICNINKNGFGDPTSGNKGLLYLMRDAQARVQSRIRLKVGPQGINHYWIMSNAMFRELLHEEQTGVSQGSGITWENIDNGFVAKMMAPHYGGIPIIFSEKFVSETVVS